MRPPEAQTLFFADGLTLHDYQITKEQTLHMVIRLRGGMYHFTSGREDMHILSQTKIEILIKTLTGMTFEVSLPARDTTVAQVKAAVADKAGIPMDRQTLIFKGKILEDERQLAEYKVMEGNTFYLVLKPTEEERKQFRALPMEERLAKMKRYHHVRTRVMDSCVM